MLKSSKSDVDIYSFSKLTTIHTCPYEYYLTYYKKNRGTQNAFSQYGTFMHSILEEYARGKYEVFELKDVFEEYYSQNVSLSFPPNKWVNLNQSYYEQGIDYLSKFEGFDDHKILDIEYEFLEQIKPEKVLNGDKKTLENKEIYLRGFIDLVLEDKEGNIIVLDHKSKSNFKNKAEKKTYTRQLYLYSYAIQAKYGKLPTKLMFNMFRKQHTEVIEFNLDDYKEALTWMFKTRDMIDDMMFFEPKGDKFYCNYLCNHRLTCDRRKEELNG